MPDPPVKKNYFELFKQIAKEEFGVEIQRRTDGKKQTFEEIFGVDLDSVFMCVDCPDGCPLETPKDPKNDGRFVEPENRALTVEELKDMVGEPVFITPCGEEAGEAEVSPGWEIIVDYYDPVINLVGAGTGDDWASFRLLGKTWLAFSRRPTEDEIKREIERMKK